MTPTALSLAEARFRLADWAARHMAIVSKSGPEWLATCPICGEDKLALNVARRAFQCLRASCGFRSRQVSVLVAAVLGVGVTEAQVLVIAQAAGWGGDPVPALEVPVVQRRGPMPLASLPSTLWQLLPTQHAYVRSRGIPDEHVAAFGLCTILSDGTGSKADRALGGRVMFPVWSASGRVVFWCARAIDNHPAKVINMPRPCREGHGEWCACYHHEWGLPEVPGAADAGEVVLGGHLVARGQTVIVVEGPVDAAVGGPGFVSTLGAHLTPMQAKAIAMTGASDAVVLYDGDKGGAVALPGVVDLLSAFLPTRGVLCPPGTDPGSLGRGAALAVVAAAAPVGGVDRLVTPSIGSAPVQAPSRFLRAL